ncbi:MAG TPA: hypothetical protein PLP89_01250 [Synergistales bacterium]|nr:hypothetical protein [Synergistales bacterium]HRV71683.1 hypothetical protein [Thermovirgaceae bacterium]
MKNRVCLLIMTALLLWTLPAAADHSASGTVSGPTPYVYTIKCDPGERFLVEVTSTQPTSVNILSMTPNSRADGGWAFNAVKSSQQAYSHLLDHSAPSGEPRNNASHWHYRVSILASTYEPADFTLSVSLFKDGSDDFNKRAREQLVDLGKNLDQENKSLKEKIAAMSWLKDTVEELNERKARLMENYEEIERIIALVKSETDPQEKQRLVDIGKTLVAEGKADEAQYKDDYQKIKADLELYNSMIRKRKAVQDLGNSLEDPFNRKDYAACVAIANGSDIARELGWVILEK